MAALGEVARAGFVDGLVERLASEARASGAARDALREACLRSVRDAEAAGFAGRADLAMYVFLDRAFRDVAPDLGALGDQPWARPILAEPGLAPGQRLWRLTRALEDGAAERAPAPAPAAEARA